MKEYPKFQTIAELMNFVETEARKKVEEAKRIGSTDEEILYTLKKFDKPVSLDLLVHETGIEKTRLCKKLNTLQKFNKVKCMTKKIVSYWKIIE
jgi:predicted Rossmann fold nucleotide-binding protein DprA/Smf involved in DNA uptake